MANEPSERWRRIEGLCEETLARDPAERAPFLDRACGDDSALRREVESLLAKASQAERFLQPDALAAAAHDVAGAHWTARPGQRLGIYEIRSNLGVGGMGEVYRARDTRLGRDVAIKLLPSHLTADSERLARFEREARTLALLNHPHIGAIYGVEEAAGVRALVLELIEGETLGDALAGKALPVERALSVAIQIAEALDHAHRRGITHRDLKPSNVMLTKSGAKLLDFGLARWARPAAVAPSAAAPTLTADPRSLTQEGTILGTLHYMAPEQLEGRDADARSDLFAFGAVLYEMLTGRQAFGGTSQASVIASILTVDPPPPSAIQPSIPARLDRVVQKCLAKDPDARWQSARDLADELTWIAEDLATAVGSPFDGSAPDRSATRPRAIGLPAAAGLVLIAAALAGWAARTLAPAAGAPAPRAVTRFMVQPPAAAALSQSGFDISPDGEQIVYTGGPRGAERLFLRRLDQFDAVPLSGTDGAFAPFFSADGQWVGFAAGGKVQKINVRSASAPVVLAGGIDSFMNANWAADGTILFATIQHGLQRVSAEGGQPTAVATVQQPAEIDHHNPQLLPGGRSVLFTIHEGAEQFAVAVVSLDSGQRKRLVDSAFDARYSPSGHLVYARGSAILAVPFDLNRLEVTGQPVTLIEHVATQPENGYGAFRMARNGSIAFEPQRSIAGRTLAWVDRSGRETPLAIPPRSFTTPRVSPDGTRLAFAAAEGDRRDIWTYEIASDRLARATRDDDNDAPLWTRDGRWLAYTSRRADGQHLVRQSIDGGVPESLLTSRNRLWPGAWTADNQALLYDEQLPTGRNHIWVLRLEGKRQPQPLFHEAINERSPSVSPDGRWLAFTSNETGRAEIYVDAVVPSGSRQQLTIDGGRTPVWSRDGRDIFYRSAGNNDGVFSVHVDTTHGLSAGKPVRLFAGHYVRELRDYDVAPDGRFLMIKPSEEEQTSPRLNVVLNWVDELARRVPAGK